MDFFLTYVYWTPFSPRCPPLNYPGARGLHQPMCKQTEPLPIPICSWKRSICYLHIEKYLPWKRVPRSLISDNERLTVHIQTLRVHINIMLLRLMVPKQIPIFLTKIQLCDILPYMAGSYVTTIVLDMILLSVKKIWYGHKSFTYHCHPWAQANKQKRATSADFIICGIYN